MGGRGNPNHDPHTGRFTSGSGISDVDKRDAQIAKNKAEAQALNAEDSFRSQQAGNAAFDRRATERAQETYDFMSKKFGSDATILEGLDLNNPDKVTNYSIDLIHHYNLVPGDPACYAVAGTTAAMFDNKKIPYEFHSGICLPKSQPIPSGMSSNHVWLTSNGKIYEHFPHYRNDELGKHIEVSIIELKKGEKK